MTNPRGRAPRTVRVSPSCTRTARVILSCGTTFTIFHCPSSDRCRPFSVLANAPGTSPNVRTIRRAYFRAVSFFFFFCRTFLTAASHRRVPEIHTTPAITEMPNMSELTTTDERDCLFYSPPVHRFTHAAVLNVRNSPKTNRSHSLFAKTRKFPRKFSVKKPPRKIRPGYTSAA